jgi:hypothetical protein
MINTFLAVAVYLVLIATHLLFLVYGLRLGKAMQKDIPPIPVVETVKKVYKRVKMPAEPKEPKVKPTPDKNEPTGLYD